jgi:hypothetical protein
MIRFFSLLLLVAACAPTLRSIDRGQWVLVTTDDSKSQELITQDAYEKEVVAGRERKVKLAIDTIAPVLHEAHSPLELGNGEVLRFRLNEGSSVDLQSDEAVIDTYWTESYRVDGWKGDQAVETKESMVYLRALKPGKAKLKLVDATWGTHEFSVIVK